MKAYVLMKSISIMLSIGLILMSFSSCKKAKLPNPLTATFQIKEVIPLPDFSSKETYDTDSVSTPEIEFVADQPEDSTIMYQWKIGSDTRAFTLRNFSLWFPPGIDSAQVMLLVKRKDINGSITETRTSSRTFYIRKSQVEGHYQGTFEGISQKADVYIKRDFKIPGWYDMKGILITTNIQQFDSLFSPDVWRENIVLNRRIYFDWANTVADGINTKVKFPYGSISLDKDYKTLTIDLSVIQVGTEKKIPMKFKGSKIF